MPGHMKYFTKKGKVSTGKYYFILSPEHLENSRKLHIFSSSSKDKGLGQSISNVIVWKHVMYWKQLSGWGYVPSISKSQKSKRKRGNITRFRVLYTKSILHLRRFARYGNPCAI